MAKEKRSKLKDMTKDDLKDYADRKYGISLSTSDTKKEMIDQFYQDLAVQSRRGSSGGSRNLENLQNNMMYIAVVLGILVIISLGYNVKVSSQLSDINSKLGGEVQAAPNGNGGGGGDQPAPSPSPTAEVGVDDDPVKGEEDAPITIIEFSDFECPFCKRFYDNTLSQIEENWIQTGKAKLVYRDLPLERIHPQAMKAAVAGECADEQGQFWEYHDKIFDNQDQLSESSLKQWADDIGLDTNQFNSCLDNMKYEDEVRNDMSDAQSAGASGTPTFFINGKKLVGAQPYSQFEQVLNSEMN